MNRLQSGDVAPSFSALDQHGETVSLTDFKGRRLFVFFYPKANTSGWTTQAQAVRDVLPDLMAAGVAVVGISPDEVAQQKKFDDKHGLGFALLSDSDHRIAEAYGVWSEKKMVGKTFMGIVRSAFLIDAAGNIDATGYNISPPNTVPTLQHWLAWRHTGHEPGQVANWKALTVRYDQGVHAQGEATRLRRQPETD